MRPMIFASLAAAGVFAAAAFADDRRPAPGAERQWLSIPQIHDKLEAAGYRNVEKIERESGSYEVKATNRQGERVKLYLHPQTGEVIDRRDGGYQRDKYDRNRPGSGRSGIECNERRCRDDLPQPAPAK